MNSAFTRGDGFGQRSAGAGPPFGRPEDGLDNWLVRNRRDKGLAPHVVFQSVFEPKINRDWAGQEQDAAGPEGQWRFEKSPYVTVTHEQEALRSHGRAFMKVLAPENIAILKIGGEKHFADNLDGKTADVDNNYGGFVKLAPIKQIEAGGYWRFHVTPGEPSAAYSFLTAIEATDSKQTKPSGALELLPSDALLAARVGPNLVLFARGGGVLESGSVKVPAEGIRRVVVADLQPQAEHVLTIGGKEVARVKTTAAGMLLVKGANWPAGELLEVRRARQGERP